MADVKDKLEYVSLMLRQIRTLLYPKIFCNSLRSLFTAYELAKVDDWLNCYKLNMINQ